MQWHDLKQDTVIILRRGSEGVLCTVETDYVQHVKKNQLILN